MSKREPITAATLTAVARENAAHPLAAERAETYAAIMEGLLQQIDALRGLPLKDLEPATVFQPIEVAKR